MAVRSIVTVDVDDSAFQRFAKQFDTYREALASTPEMWKDAGKATETVANAALAAGGAALAAAKSFHNITRTQSTISRAAESQSRFWHNIATDAGKFAAHITEATRSLLRWGALTGLVSGILGVGGLFGIERLALSAGNQRAQALALGMKPGDAKAFETELGARGYDADAFLGNVNKGMMDLTSPQFLALRGLGMDYSRDIAGKDTSTVALDALTKLKSQIDQIPLGPMFEPMAHARYLDQAMSMADLERLRRTPAGEVGDYARRIQQNQRAMAIPDATAKAWQDLTARLSETGTAFKNMLIDKLVALAPAIDKLSQAFLKVVDDLLSRPEVKQWIEGLADGIKWLADYLMGDKFKAQVGEFVDEIGKFTASVYEFVNVLLDAGKAVSVWTDRIFGSGGGQKGKTPYDSDPSQPFEDPNVWGGGTNKWGTDNLFKWWHGTDTTPPPTGVQKERFDQLEGQQGLPPGLLNGVFQAESGGGRHLFSPAGAIGDFQFTPSAWQTYGNGGNPFDFNDSSAAAARYFHHLLEEFHGDVAKAAAGYNAGEGNVERAISRYGENWRQGLPKPEETLPYIDRVVRALGAHVSPNGQPQRGGVTTITINNNTGANVVVSSSQLIA